MNLGSLMIAHWVLKSGGVRQAARALDCSPSTVSAAMRRLQSEIAIPLVARSGEGTQPTLEGIRLMRDLATAAAIILRLSKLAPGTDGSPERRAARISTSPSTLGRFARVAREGSIRKAAQQVGIGQPQLTRQLRTMERDLGVTVFRRHTHGITLLEKGRTVLAQAEALERIWSRLSKHAERRFRESLVVAKCGSIIPFGPESITAKVLALLAAEWHRRTPDDPLFISSAISEELIASLQSRALDVILLDTDAIPPGLRYRTIVKSRMVLVAAPSAAATKASIRDLLLSTPVALLSLKSGLRQKFVSLMEAVLSESERERLSIVEADSMPVIANLVRDHGFLTLLPELSLGASASTFDCTYAPASFSVHLSLVWRPAPSSEKVARRIFDILGDAGLPGGSPSARGRGQQALWKSGPLSALSARRGKLGSNLL